MDKEGQLRLLRKAFSDISRGYSIAFLKNKRVYIKHLSHHEQVDLDILYKSYMDSGLAEGLNSESFMLTYLKEEGIWTENDEKELKDLETIIERLVEAKKVLYRKTELEVQNKIIEEHRVNYIKKKNAKDKLLGLTAESYAEKKINEHYIIESFFRDNNFQDKYITEDVFEALSDQDVRDIVKLYNDEMDVVGDRNIKLLSIQEFFQIYWGLSAEDLRSFFGIPICNLTYFQIKLASYARTFRDILSKSENLPEDIRNDPDKLLDYVRAGENAKEKMEGRSSQGPKEDGAVASTLIGAKSDEYKAIGMTQKDTVSLTQELKKKQAEGKKGLDIHDLMRMMGT